MSGSVLAILLAACSGWFCFPVSVEAQTANPPASKDAVAAAESYRKAAEAGDGRAMETLGNMYAAGSDGLPKDDAQALYWYRKGADAGDALAMTNLGVMYFNGRGGLPKDEAQAVNWFRKAAQAGDGLAMSNLGHMYLNGLGGLPKDEAQAVNWYRQAAQAGDGRGMGNLGFMYLNGLGGLPRDDTQAVSWFRKAAAAGDGSGMAKLGFMYLNGLGGLPKDSIQAVTWLHKAETAGDAAIIAAVEKTLTALEAKSSFGCVGRDKLSDQLTPLDLYNTMAACIGRENYDDAVFFFMLAGVYGRFDALRVKDVSAHGVLRPLPEIFLALEAVRENGNQNPANAKDSAFKTKESIFKERMRQLNQNATALAKYCSDIMGISPPGYLPFYMLNHGLGAVPSAITGNPQDRSPLVSPFDKAKAWKQAVTEYLVCPTTVVATPQP